MIHSFARKARDHRAVQSGGSRRSPNGGRGPSRSAGRLDYGDLAFIQAVEFIGQQVNLAVGEVDLAFAMLRYTLSVPKWTQPALKKDQFSG